MTAAATTTLSSKRQVVIPEEIRDRLGLKTGAQFVVIDTNVVVSGVFFGGTPSRVLAAWSAGRFVMVLAPAILDEYRRVSHDLGHRHPGLGAAFEPLLTLITMHAIIVDAPPLADPVSVDPDDDMFLAAALAAQAQFIVSGDRDLLEVSGWHDIAVLTPRHNPDRWRSFGRVSRGLSVREPRPSRGRARTGQRRSDRPCAFCLTSAFPSV